MARIIAGLLLILLSQSKTASSQVLEAVSPPRRHVVEIREFDFHPQRTVASPGDTVVWVNRDVVPHTATAEDSSWDSQELGEGQAWEMIVKDSGMQRYSCEYHPHMTGVLETRSTIGH